MIQNFREIDIRFLFFKNCEIIFVVFLETSGSDEHCRRVRTLYACVGEHESELSFEPNQVLTDGK